MENMFVYERMPEIDISTCYFPISFAEYAAWCMRHPKKNHRKAKRANKNFKRAQRRK